jgi:hypothetical protein
MSLKSLFLLGGGMILGAVIACLVIVTELTK